MQTLQNRHVVSVTKLLGIIENHQMSSLEEDSGCVLHFTDSWGNTEFGCLSEVSFCNRRRICVNRLASPKRKVNAYAIETGGGGEVATVFLPFSATGRRSVDTIMQPIWKRNLEKKSKVVFSGCRKMQRTPCTFLERADMAAFDEAWRFSNWSYSLF